MTSPTAFLEDIHWILQREGCRWDAQGNLVATGYVDDPDDPGGETNFGIAKRWHPNEDIKNMTLGRATQIYKYDYWDKFNCGTMSDPWALFVFDSAVQHPPSAVTLFEKENALCDALKDREQFYRDIVVHNPNETKYLDGWLKRLSLLKIRLFDAYGISCT